MGSMIETAENLLPAMFPLLIVLAASMLALWLAHYLLFHKFAKSRNEGSVLRWLILLALVGTAVVLVLLALPVAPETRHQLLGLLGVLLSAIVAFSSTTFVANMMAGFMLRAVRSFKPGDFVKVGDQFGRVTERGLFYAEIQTENRDLTTIPNLYMISHPITVVRSTGTIVSATVSLGYDISHSRIEPLLIHAAVKAQLVDPFVQVMELGDFSVTYRVAGFLTEVKQILTARSNLRTQMLDSLHGDGIEIVSPTFMNLRPQSPGVEMRPPESDLRRRIGAVDEDSIPEELIFDKAEAVEKMAELKEERDGHIEKLKTLEMEHKVSSGATRARLDGEIGWRQKRVAAIEALLAQNEDVDQA
jgi:small-conductance mechanosensitive channel